MRPLYIQGKPGCRVVLDEPALRVVMPEKADVLFPLSRISRVVCLGVVDWSMSALLACADAGVLVLFLQHNGEVRARWLGQQGVRQSLTQRLLDLLARGDGPARYENWRLSMEKLAVRHFARKSGLPDWREVSIAQMRLQVEQCLTAALRREANTLSSLLYAEVMGWLPECGLVSDDEALLAGQLDLAADLSRLLMWDFYPGLLQAAMAPTAEQDLPSMALLLAQRADRCYLLFRSSINKLHQFLLTVS